jgi:hypothetical protein
MGSVTNGIREHFPWNASALECSRTPFSANQTWSPDLLYKRTLLTLGLFTAALTGCDKFPFFFPEDRPIVISDKAQVLGIDPLHLSMPGSTKVIGVDTELCVTLSDHFTGAKEDADEITAEFNRLKGDARPIAVLHATDGKDYTWKCDNWQIGGMNSEVGVLNSCFKWECNQQQAPPKGTEIASVDLKSDVPLQILGVTWRSTEAFDFISNPPPDPFGVSSAEYADLEKAFGDQALWSSDGKLAMQIELHSARRDRSFSTFHSTINLHLSESGIQLQPAPNTVGMGLVTIPSAAIAACSMRCWGPLARETNVVLPEPSIVLSVLNAPEVNDWCWNHHVPMISGRDREAWLHHGTPLPDKTAFTAQLESRAAYDEQAKRSCQGY